MVFHNTQCPHCFTDYTISEEQYRTSEGMVRCGTCREQFRARLVDGSIETPKFDPRDVFIEPLSEPLKAREGGDIELSKEPEPSYVSYDKPVDLDDEPFELLSTHEFEYTEPKEPTVPADVLSIYGNSQELTTSEILNNLREKRLRESSSENDNGVTEQHSVDLTAITTESSNTTVQGQLDLELPVDDKKASVADQRKEPELNQKEDKLIDEVDKLVDEKLLAAPKIPQSNAPQNQSRPTASATTRTTVNKVKKDDFFLQPRKKTKKPKRGFTRWLITFLTLFFTLLLVMALAYQLWLKQLIDMPSDQAWFNSLQETVIPLYNRVEQTASNYEISLPQRRNLSQLELVSAQTQPHPTRSTTILLKVSLINHADIAQALPWLEMSLTNADGRLVARRNLSPKSYIYNNKTSSTIGSKELKKITIELLSFPKSATGYEIKLLDN